MKRRVREIVRVHLLNRLPGVDAVIKVWPTAYSVQFSVLHDELIRCAKELADSAP